MEIINLVAKGSYLTLNERKPSPGNKGTEKLQSDYLHSVLWVRKSFTCLIGRREEGIRRRKRLPILQNSELLVLLEEGGNNKNKDLKSTLGSFKRHSI